MYSDPDFRLLRSVSYEMSRPFVFSVKFYYKESVTGFFQCLFLRHLSVGYSIGFIYYMLVFRAYILFQFLKKHYIF